MFWQNWKRKAERDAASAADGARRIEVLESTEVDPARRLVLVRCDDVEHLIMVGGPADLVVENDVRRRRAGARPIAKPAVQEQPPRPEPAQPRPEPDPARTAAKIPAPTEPERTESRAERKAERRAEQPAPAAQPAERTGQEDAPPAVSGSDAPRRAATAPIIPNPRALLREEKRRRAREEASQQPETSAAGASQDGAGKVRTQAGEPHGGTREIAATTAPPAPLQAPRPAAASPAAPVQIPKPVAASFAAPVQSPGTAAAPADSRLRLQPVDGGRRDAEPGERRPRPAREEPDRPREAVRQASLPTAATPWTEPESIENEIVRALRIEPRPSAVPGEAAAGAGRDTNQAASAASDTTTLGDLANRLEEALAREVQSSGAHRAPAEIDLDSFGFGRERGSRNRTDPSPSPRERMDTRAVPPASEAEPRRDMRAPPERPERQEETPVISLNARRREPVDPLEDEMARLLGELTGDTTRR